MSGSVLDISVLFLASVVSFFFSVWESESWGIAVVWKVLSCSFGISATAFLLCMPVAWNLEKLVLPLYLQIIFGICAVAMIAWSVFQVLWLRKAFID